MGETAKSPTTKRYPPEFKERAVRMVRALRAETGQKHGTIQRVAAQLDCGVESLRLWVKQAEIDVGEAPGTSSEDAARIKALEQENRELRRANEILKRASAFFAAELDRPQR
jgi:transposase